MSVDSRFDVLDEPVTRHSRLSRHTVLKLASSLTLKQEVSRRDWTGVAGILGFDARQIGLMEQHSEQNKGWLLLRIWDDMEKGSLRLLMFALLEKTMRECLDTLKEDPAISDECYQKVLTEHEQLKQETKVKKEFPRLRDEDVYRALYPNILNVEPTSPPLQSSLHHEQDQVTEQLQKIAIVDRPHQEQVQRNGVFISYCPESSRKFNKYLTKFANLIRNQGYTVYFEPFCTDEIRQRGGINCWKEMCIKRSEDIIIVCTPEYFKEDQKMMDGLQSKIAVESRLLRQLAYSSEHTRLVPVMFDKIKVYRNTMPMWLQSAVLHRWPSCEDDLLFYLARQSKFVIPPPTKKKVLKPIVIDFKEARKHNPYK